MSVSIKTVSVVEFEYVGYRVSVSKIVRDEVDKRSRKTTKMMYYFSGSADNPKTEEANQHIVIKAVLPILLVVSEYGVHQHGFPIWGPIVSRLTDDAPGFPIYNRAIGARARSSQISFTVHLAFL